MDAYAHGLIALVCQIQIESLVFAVRPPSADGSYF